MPRRRSPSTDPFLPGPAFPVGPRPDLVDAWGDPPRGAPDVEIEADDAAPVSDEEFAASAELAAVRVDQDGRHARAAAKARARVQQRKVDRVVGRVVD